MTSETKLSRSSRGIEKQLSRLELEQERARVEQELAQLEEDKSKRRKALQREQRKTLKNIDSCGGHSTKDVSSSTTTAKTYSSASSASSNDLAACSQCCRKDRIIHRQRREIEALRQELMESQNRCVPLNFTVDHDADSVVSGFTDR